MEIKIGDKVKKRKMNGVGVLEAEVLSMTPTEVTVKSSAVDHPITMPVTRYANWVQNTLDAE